VAELDIGQAGSTRRTAGDAQWIGNVLVDPGEVETRIRGFPQQQFVVVDRMGSRGRTVMWEGSIRVNGIALVRTIEAELDQYMHGSLRSAGVLGAPDASYIKPTELRDSEDQVLSDQAIMLTWRRRSNVMRIQPVGNMDRRIDIEIVFRTVK